MSAPITYSVKLDAVRGMIRAKIDWLDRFSGGPKKRPDHEIMLKRREVTILGAIEEDYRKAVEVTGEQS